MQKTSLFVIHTLLLFLPLCSANICPMRHRVESPRITFARLKEEFARDAQRSRKLLARLASLPSLATLPAREQRALVEEFRRPSGQAAAVRIRTFISGRSADGHAEKGWRPSGLVPLAWIEIWEAHSWARRILNDLLDGTPVDLTPLTRYTAPVLVLSEDGFYTRPQGVEPPGARLIRILL